MNYLNYRAGNTGPHTAFWTQNYSSSRETVSMVTEFKQWSTAELINSEFYCIESWKSEGTNTWAAAYLGPIFAAFTGTFCALLCHSSIHSRSVFFFSSVTRIRCSSESPLPLEKVYDVQNNQTWREVEANLSFRNVMNQSGDVVDGGVYSQMRFSDIGNLQRCCYSRWWNFLSALCSPQRFPFGMWNSCASEVCCVTWSGYCSTGAKVFVVRQQTVQERPKYDNCSFLYIFHMCTTSSSSGCSLQGSPQWVICPHLTLSPASTAFSPTISMSSITTSTNTMKHHRWRTL